MRIFKLTLFLGVWLVAVLLDFLFPIETNCQLAELGTAAIAAIAGGSALLSGAANLIDSASTNKANKEINESNQKWQSAENEKSRLWSQREWDRQFEKQNTYNTPTAQRARLEQAGYNPYLVNGQIVGSNHVASPSTPSDGARGVPNSIPMQRSDYGFVAQGGRDAVSAYLNTKSVDANVANQSAKTDQEIIKNASDIYHLTGDRRQSEAYLNRGLKSNNGAAYNLDNSPLVREYQAKASKDEADADYARTVADLKALYGDKEMRSALMLQSLEGKKIKEEMLSLAKDRSKTDAEISKIISDKIKNYAEANHINADTRTINATRDLLIEGMRHDNKVKKADAEIRGYEAGEESASFKQRSKARMYMVSPEGVDDALHNQVTRDNQAINRLDRIKDAINPLKMSSSK